MRKATAQQWDDAILRVVESIGLKRVIEQIGVDRLVQHIGIKRILAHMTEQDIIQALVSGWYKKPLTAADKEALRRLLEMPPPLAKKRAGRSSSKKRPARNASPRAAK